MAEEIPLDGSKFIKTKSGWVNKKTQLPVDADKQNLLNTISKKLASETPKVDVGEDLKKVSESSDDIAKKINENLSSLTKVVEKLAKSIEKLASKKAAIEQIPQVEDPATQIPVAPTPVPSILSAVKDTAKERLFGEKDQYGRITKPGVIRSNIEQEFPISKLLFAARDKQRDIKAKNAELAEAEAKKPKLESPDSDLQEPATLQEAPEIIPEKSTRTPFRPGMFDSDSKTTQTTKSEILSVVVSDASENFLKKLSNSLSAVFKEKSEESSASAEEQKSLKEAVSPENHTGPERILSKIDEAANPVAEAQKKSGKKGSIFDTAKDIFDMFKGKGKGAKGLFKNLFKRGGATALEGAAVEGAEVAGTAGVEAVEAAPGLLGKVGGFAKEGLGKVGGGLAKGLGKAGGLLGTVGGFAKEGLGKVGGGLVKGLGKAGGGLVKGLGKAGGLVKGIPGVGAAIAGGMTGLEEYKKTGSLGKALLVGGLTGAGTLGGEVVGGAVGSLAGPVGTVVGEVGGGIAGAAGGEALAHTLLGEDKKPAQMAQSKGPSAQTQAVHQMSKQNQLAKDSKPAAGGNSSTNISSPTINNNNSYVGQPTISKKGSLDLKTFA